MLHLLLAAAPLPPPQPEVISAPALLAMILSGGSALFTIVFWIVRGLGGRVVKQEDERVAALQRQQDRHEAEVKLLTGAHIQTQADVRVLTTTVEKVSTQLERFGADHRDEMRELAASIDKKLDEVEIRMRQDTTRAVADSISRAKRGRA